MILNILLVILAISLLMIFHELGHFFFAKIFKVKVKELGLGLPPRILGKKIGGTIYSLNLIPFGAFLRLKGERKKKEEKGSFFKKPYWQKFLIISGGVLSFWLISFLLYSVVFKAGAQVAVSDEEPVKEAKIMVISTIEGTPAEKAGLSSQDIILKIKIKEKILIPQKMEEFRNFIRAHPNVSSELEIKRGKEIIKKEVILSEKEGKGFLGIYFQRVAIVKYPFLKAIFQGGKTTLLTTKLVFESYGRIFKSLISERKVPLGMEVVGPIGIGNLMIGASKISFLYFLQVLAAISIFMAVINILPIPALDGGRLLFLTIEAIRGRAINERIELAINNFFFFLLIILLVFLTIKDILKLL